MLKKVMYDEMEPADKTDYLKVRILEHEQALRERTDRTLQSQQAFDLILDNQRFFAKSQDKFANLAKKAREEIALRSVREVNQLIAKRKNLQIEAFRLTENFKIKVNSMTQKDIDNLFAKTANKKQSKQQNIRRKVNKNGLTSDQMMKALAVVADEGAEEEDYAAQNF